MGQIELTTIIECYARLNARIQMHCGHEEQQERRHRPVPLIQPMDSATSQNSAEDFKSSLDTSVQPICPLSTALTAES